MTEDKPSESFVRWQQITISQHTYSINLFLGLSVATLGFQITLLLNYNLVFGCFGRLFFIVSVVLILFSTGFGIWCVINRLKDFRLTANIASRREKCESDDSLKPDRDKSKNLGKATWRLYWWQVGTFGVGVLLVVGIVGFSVVEKLY